MVILFCQGHSISSDGLTMDLGASATPSNSNQSNSSMAVIGLSRAETAEDIRNRTVVIKMDVRGKPYDRFQMAEALEKTIDLGQVQCFGPLGRNVEWYLTLDSEFGKMTMLRQGTLTVGRFNGAISSASNKEAKLRIHWLPPWVSDDDIVLTLNKCGFDVVAISLDKSAVKTLGGGSLQHSFIPVRTIIVKNNDAIEIPHLIDVHDRHFNEIHSALVTIIGRAPLCLRCRKVGHFRSDCPAPFCAKCKRVGHPTSQCEKKQYSAAVAPVVDPSIDMNGDVSQSGESSAAPVGDSSVSLVSVNPPPAASLDDTVSDSGMLRAVEGQDRPLDVRPKESVDSQARSQSLFSSPETFSSQPSEGITPGQTVKKPVASMMSCHDDPASPAHMVSDSPPGWQSRKSRDRSRSPRRRSASPLPSRERRGERNKFRFKSTDLDMLTKLAPDGPKISDSSQ